MIVIQKYQKLCYSMKDGNARKRLCIKNVVTKTVRALRFFNPSSPINRMNFAFIQHLWLGNLPLPYFSLFLYLFAFLEGAIYMLDHKPMENVLLLKGSHHVFQIHFTINYCTLIEKKKKPPLYYSSWLCSKLVTFGSNWELSHFSVLFQHFFFCFHVRTVEIRIFIKQYT